MALRTGAEYLDALRDGREVYLDGRRVKDVTAEPGLREVAHTFARMYDLVIANPGGMTFHDENGALKSGTWIESRNRDQLVWRRNFTEMVARRTGGLFGRSQEYVPLFHLGMLNFKGELSRGDRRFERNIENYWRRAREKDLMLSHGFATVQPPSGVALEDTMMPRIVARDADAIVVRGAKTVATFAAHSDEIFVGSLPYPGMSEDHVMYFSVPIATPGLRVVARTPYATGGVFDHPASQYGDENDCIVILDDVRVPWERVFGLGGDPGRCAWIFPRISEWAHWSILARIAVKAEVVVGLYALIPEMMGRSQQPHAQEAIAEAIRYLITLRAFIHASEDQGTVTSAGYYMPNPTYVTAGRAYSVEHYRRIAGYLHDIGGQSLINMASEKSFDSPDVGPSLEKIFSNPAASARDRARVTRLGWDMVCDSFGARQTLFELFNAAPWTAQRAQLAAEFDLAPYRRLALATAGIGSLEEAAAAMPVAAHTKDRNYEAAATSFKGGRR
jgi:4-hydroxyphenylacetate 3-monooxygenase